MWTTYKAEEIRSVNLKHLKNKPRRSWKKVGLLYISGTATLRSWNPFQARLQKVIKIPTRKLTVSQQQRSSEFLGKRKRPLFKLTSKLVSPLTKRKILAAINSVYDLLGWASPVMITGKILFSELCLCKVSWDEQVPDDIVRRWNQWAKTLRECTKITVP